MGIIELTNELPPFPVVKHATYTFWKGGYMKTLKIFRRKPRHLRDERRGAGSAGDDEGAPVLATGLKLAVLTLQVVGALVQLLRR
jgi:hypothetical protein